MTAPSEPKANARRHPRGGGDPNGGLDSRLPGSDWRDSRLRKSVEGNERDSQLRESERYDSRLPGNDQRDSPLRKSDESDERDSQLAERDEEPLITVRNVSKAYRRGGQIVPVLNDISFDVRRGDFLGLMGPSGSGKSTLLNLIAGIDKPDAGEILFDGVDITRLAETELADWRAGAVGFVFQFYNLMPVLTAFENVELPLTLTRLTRRERAEHVEAALALVGLADRMEHYPSELSGGQQQRVAIARALTSDPKLVVADEPTGDLDRQSAEDVLALMDRLNVELSKTILMVTHDRRAAERAHAIMYLDKGELARGDDLHERSVREGRG
jgi:putative ABC transport system ATP-binding protein